MNKLSQVYSLLQNENIRYNKSINDEIDHFLRQLELEINKFTETDLMKKIDNGSEIDFHNIKINSTLTNNQKESWKKNLKERLSNLKYLKFNITTMTNLSSYQITIYVSLLTLKEINKNESDNSIVNFS